MDSQPTFCSSKRERTKLPSGRGKKLVPNVPPARNTLLEPSVEMRRNVLLWPSRYTIDPSEKQAKLLTARSGLDAAVSCRGGAPRIPRQLQRFLTFSSLTAARVFPSDERVGLEYLSRSLVMVRERPRGYSRIRMALPPP